MWKRILLFILLFAVLAVTSVYGEYMPGRIRVRFKPNVVNISKGARIAAVQAANVRASSVQALNAKHGVFKVKQLFNKVLEIRPDRTDLADYYTLEISPESDVEKVAQDYLKDPNVISASPVSIVHAFDTTPNDPYFTANQQYGLVNIQAPKAWDRTTGSNGISVAVLDTGVNYLHDDLQGKVDVANGWNFVDNNSDPMDDHYSAHGTLGSGIIAAATNNNKGIAGLNWQGKILPVKVLNYNGDGNMDDILAGIEWAVAKNAKVINMSFGQYVPDSDLQQHCLDAYNAGVILVAAAGNGDVDWPTFPAYYPTVVAVAAVTQSDVRATWTGTDPTTGRTQASNFGSWVDVSAPGDNLWSTYKGTNQYAAASGTSFASPMVAGLAALVKSAFPGYTNRQIIDKITSEADNVDALNPGYEGKLGSGRINAYLAIAGVIARVSSPESNDYISGPIDITGSAAGWDFSQYILEVLSGGTVIATLETSTTSIEGGHLGSWDTTPYNGQYTIHLKVTTLSSGSAETSVSVYVDNTTPEAAIISPIAGATVEGIVPINGTAKDQYLNKYVLEYKGVDAPTIYGTIMDSYNQVDTGLLGTWETAGLEKRFDIKLTVSDMIGRSVVKTVRVNVRKTSSEKKAESFTALAVPNPASSEAALTYKLLGNFETKIYAFDISGNLIWQESYAAGDNGGKAGDNNPTWDLRSKFSGNKVANGVYLLMVVADGKVIAKGKLIVLN
ncbi:MAG: S8 family serine peptidase [Candidatus Margulisbacteria bacterium]|nr:S8 family serine peptidase [Candidatus Margulisiibacteriota bacterium]